MQSFSRIYLEFLKTTISSFSWIVQFKKRKFDSKRWTCVTFLYSIPNWVKYNGSIFVDCSWYIINFTLMEFQALVAHHVLSTRFQVQSLLLSLTTFDAQFIMNKVEIKFRKSFCFCQSVHIRKFPLMFGLSEKHTKFEKIFLFLLYFWSNQALKKSLYELWRPYLQVWNSIIVQFLWQ